MQADFEVPIGKGDRREQPYIMQIQKVINNNIVTSIDHKQREIIVMGKGLGFGRKSGEEIPAEKIEKVFLIRDSENSNRFETLLESMPLDYVKTADKVIGHIKQSIGDELNENIYITLTDHISFAVERYHKGIPIKNALLWETKKFYQREFEIGMEALKIIEKELSVELPEDEAGFIALHIVNAQVNNDMNKSMTMIKLIQDILNIVKYFYNMEIEQGYDYERFTMHLKYFIQRIYSGHEEKSTDEEFVKIIAAQYPKAYECSGKIREYIFKKLEYLFGEEEMAYLTVHIQKITRK